MLANPNLLAPALLRIVTHQLFLVNTVADLATKLIVVPTRILTPPLLNPLRPVSARTIRTVTVRHPKASTSCEALCSLCWSQSWFWSRCRLRQLVIYRLSQARVNGSRVFSFILDIQLFPSRRGLSFPSLPMNGRLC